jgi:hypothetical protein
MLSRQLARRVELPARRELTGMDLLAQEVSELLARLASIVSRNRHA